METNFYWFHCAQDPQFYRAHDAVQRQELLHMLGTGCRGYHTTVYLTIGDGDMAGDLLCTYGPLFFVSDRVLQVFDENGFGTYETFPTEVSGERSELLPRYHGIAFHGGGVPIIDEESGRVWQKPIPDGPGSIGFVKKRIVFDTSKWDGSDLFHLDQLPASQIVTARVKDALRKAEITNCALTSLDEEFFPLPVKR